MRNSFMSYRELNSTEITNWVNTHFIGWKSQYIKKYESIDKGFGGTLTPIECYCGGWMSRVNELLRTGSSSVGNTATLNRLSEYLDMDFKDVPELEESIVVFRLVDKSEFESILNSEDNYLDKGYMSTSLNRRLCLENDERLLYKDNPYLLRIFVNIGTKALYVSFFKNAIDIESELLFPRNSKLLKMGEPYLDRELDKIVLDCKLI